MHIDFLNFAFEGKNLNCVIGQILKLIYQVCLISKASNTLGGNSLEK